MSVRFEWNGDKIIDQVDNSAGDGLFDAAEYLLGEATKLVPINEGTLQDSGETSVDKENLTCSVSYDTPYAKRLHEHPEYNFEHNRQGKWLENTFKNHGENAIEYLVKKLKGAM